MFIINSLKMIEPATVSIAIYLLSNTNKIKPNILKKEPFFYKKKICKWIKKNKHLMIEVGMDELSDFVFNVNIPISVPTLTLALGLYWILLIIFILV
jgi:hypothetical protein